MFVIAFMFVFCDGEIPERMHCAVSPNFFACLFVCYVWFNILYVVKQVVSRGSVKARTEVRQIAKVLAVFVFAAMRAVLICVKLNLGTGSNVSPGWLVACKCMILEVLLLSVLGTQCSCFWRCCGTDDESKGTKYNGRVKEAGLGTYPAGQKQTGQHFSDHLCNLLDSLASTWEGAALECDGCRGIYSYPGCSAALTP
jgi:hypothetical protein